MEEDQDEDQDEDEVPNLEDEQDIFIGNSEDEDEDQMDEGERHVDSNIKKGPRRTLNMDDIDFNKMVRWLLCVCIQFNRYEHAF